jgi:hypothetical protein
MRGGVRAALLVGLLLLAAGSIVLAARLLGRPDVAERPFANGAAGLRAQHSLVELLMRGGGVSSRTDPVALTWDELNALLARHIESRKLPLRPVLVQPAMGGVQLAGKTSLRQVLPHLALDWLVPLVPDAVLDHDLWVAVEGRLVWQPGEGQLAVERAEIGRQRVPPAWLWRLLDLDPHEHLIWRMPRIVERVETGPDRLVIFTRARGG